MTHYRPLIIPSPAHTVLPGMMRSARPMESIPIACETLTHSAVIMSAAVARATGTGVVVGIFFLCSIMEECYSQLNGVAILM